MTSCHYLFLISGGLSGFSKLQLQSNNIRGAPIIAIHDEDDDIYNSNTNNSNNKKKDSVRVISSTNNNKDNRKNPSSRSVELNGESEYLRIGGEEADIISGDQLDRLLVKAKMARSGGGR